MRWPDRPAEAALLSYQTHHRASGRVAVTATVQFNIHQPQGDDCCAYRDNAFHLPAQSMQRNLRPPVLTSVKCIGLRHSGQIGGGVFLGMAVHLGSAGALPNSQSSIDCRAVVR
jgi:hypothetical protein